MRAGRIPRGRRVRPTAAPLRPRRHEALADLRRGTVAVLLGFRQDERVAAQRSQRAAVESHESELVRVIQAKMTQDDEARKEQERAEAEEARQAAETKQRRYKCADPACTFLVHAEPAPWNGDGRYCCANCMNGVPHDDRCGRMVAPADARTKDPFYHMLRKREQRLRRLKLQELQHLRSSPMPDVPPIAHGISSCA